VLPLLESDLLEVMMATTDGKLAECEVKFANKAACCVIMASDGYPEAYKKGYEITIDKSVVDSVYVAGAALCDGKLLTSGGRVLGAVATDDTLAAAIDAAYGKVKKISFEGAFYRKDIGKKAMMANGGKC
jgi:phosphoribosylamine--glycine ligase